MKWVYRRAPIVLPPAPTFRRTAGEGVSGCCCFHIFWFLSNISAAAAAADAADAAAAADAASVHSQIGMCAILQLWQPLRL